MEYQKLQYLNLLLDYDGGSQVSFNIFISYSTNDVEIIKPLVTYLSKIEETKTFFAEKTINPGDKISQAIINSIKLSDLFLVFFSKSSAESNYVQQEIGVAIANEKIIVPILLDPTKPTGMLGDRNYLNLHNPEKRDSELKRLLNFISSKIQSKNKRRTFFVVLGGLSVAGLLIYLCSKGGQSGRKEKTEQETTIECVGPIDDYLVIDDQSAEVEFIDTGIGKIPVDWDMATLEDISLKVTDGSHSSPKESPDGSHIICTVKDMEYNQFSFENSKKISDEDFDSLVKNGCSPKEGDILISKDGANCLDLIFVYGQDKEIVLLSSIAIVRLKEGFNPHFYRYYLLSPNIQKLMRDGYVSGSAIPRVILKDFKRLPVPILPDIETQNKIADVLLSLDQKIETNRQINQVLEKIGHKLFKQWFVDFEFPDEEGNPYKSNGGEFDFDSEFGIIPKGWKINSVSEIVKIVLGGTPKRANPEYWNGDIKWASAKDIASNQGLYILETAEHITKKGLESSNTKILPKDSLVITARGTVGEICLLGESIAFNQTCYGLVAKSELHKYFLFFSLVHSMNLVDAFSYGTVFKTITMKTFDEIKIICPDDNILEKFNEKVYSIFETIFVSQKEMLHLAKILDKLLPKLMSGEIRV